MTKPKAQSELKKCPKHKFTHHTSNLGVSSGYAECERCGKRRSYKTVRFPRINE
jgi:hypothetical protein